MKWTNKLKDERWAKWQTVGPCKRERIDEAHAWCKEQPSDGLFYYHFTNSRWWFERKEDAVLFALKFSGR